ncbi:GNAT family N-acetyltransferase [Roseivivax sediminis]|uniref:Protein N-acetyltransferase, RimJ/RimL family n=1 Tax=Roseivivax sediminis TaxID=936889 RepID=A0A1I1YW07_9RHOB|nr:GNAT family N-acetyltransferase [Roseivivax sediminis]SFE23659.1 Protein N-acetyltransferase, RimJ/RimL family [Roseivivax sediminis]
MQQIVAAPPPPGFARSRAPALTTERLHLRPLYDSDAEAIARALSDPQVARWMTNVPFPYTLEDARQFLSLERGSSTWKVWAICPGAGALAGVIGLEDEFGYWLGRDHWGRGYMSEAARAVVDWHFRHPGAEPLISGHFEGNNRSGRVLRKLGFSYYGRPVAKETRSFGTVTLHRMLLAPEQWHALNPVHLRSKRLLLRPLWPDDAAALARIGGDPAVAPMMLSMSVPWPETEARKWIEGGRWRGTPQFRFAIEDTEGRLIGSVGLAQGATLHYMLSADVAGQGYATEAVRTLLAWVFSRFGLAEIVADHFDDNPASGRVLSKLGFRVSGSGTGTSRARLEPAPNTLYRLSRDDFAGSTP